MIPVYIEKYLFVNVIGVGGCKAVFSTVFRGT